MGVGKIVGLVLIIGGVLALVYGGFTYTKATHRADVGPIHFAVDEKEHVNVPLWAGVAAVVAGAALVLAARK